MAMVPPLESSSPAISLSVVDLPQPEGPSRATSLPPSTVKLMPSTAAAPPQLFDTALSSTETIRDPAVPAIHGKPAQEIAAGGSVSGRA